MLPNFLSKGGPMFWGMLWLIVFASAVAITVFIERVLHYHRAQINSTEFLNGVRTVLKRQNVVEALSICDATPGPVSRLVKTAILNRDHGRERDQELVFFSGSEVHWRPRSIKRAKLAGGVAAIPTPPTASPFL